MFVFLYVYFYVVFYRCLCGISLRCLLGSKPQLPRSKKQAPTFYENVLSNLKLVPGANTNSGYSPALTLNKMKGKVSLEH